MLSKRQFDQLICASRQISHILIVSEEGLCVLYKENVSLGVPRWQTALSEVSEFRDGARLLVYFQGSRASRGRHQAMA